MSKEERDYYLKRKKWIQEERENNKLVRSELFRTYRSNVLHLSIDAMQNKKYTTFPRYREPAVYYFIKKLTLHLLGVVDEGRKDGRVYLYDDRLGSTNSNHTISALLDMINERLGSRRVLWVNVDNCAVNKNRFVSILI